MNFQHISGLMSAHAEARILHAAVELGVFDCLVPTPLQSAAVSAQLGTEPAATELLLDALVALQILNKNDAVFSLSEAARNFLVSASPTSLCGMVRFESSRWNDWGKLVESIRTGRAARPANMYQDDPHETATFIEAMASLVTARGDAEVMAQKLDWQNVRSLLDIGSGPATYPIHLCRRFPGLCATIFDLPGTLKITERYVRQAGLADRITLVAGDYRSEEIPGPYDFILLSNIIHGENSERNAALLRKLAPLLNPGGRIVIKDHILDQSRTNPPVGAIFSMLMLLTTDGGRCYSFAEIRAWMAGAGLIEITQVDLPAPLTSSLVIGSRS